jgi:pimeloyl-ACP methyl ester carboxylesterase
LPSPQEGVEEWLQLNWAQAPETFSVEVEGAAIACRAWNRAAAHLPGVVLVHGFRAHARWWDHIAPALAERHRVVALDLSGMGDSDRRAEYSRAQIGREILAVAAHCGFDPVTVVAHSFGAIGSLIAARTEPDRIRRLIVIDSAVPTLEDADHQIMSPPQRYYPDADTAVSRFRLIPPGKWPQPSVLDYIARHSVRQAPQGWTWKFDPAAAASFNRERYRELLFGVPVRVDVIHGDRTEIMTPPRRAQLREMASDIGEDIVIPASHHHVLIEQPIALVAALGGLLNDGQPAD